MELADQLLDAWRISARIALYLLEELTPEQYHAPLEKGKTVSGQFSHIHNVRLMWLKASAPDLHESLQKIDAAVTVEELAAALKSSGEATEEMIRRGLAEGRVKNFKPHPAAFVAYLVSHEAFHRGHVELALRQAGVPLSDKVAYGAWEWGVR